MSALLDDVTSRDSHRVWSSTSVIARLRDRVELDELAAHLAEIKAAIENLDLGGALYPNNERLKYAIHRLEFWRDKSGCLCLKYPGYPFFNPNEEVTEGNVTILEKITDSGGWTLSYSCQCTVCGARYAVEEGESHYMWWEWHPA